MFTLSFCRFLLIVNYILYVLLFDVLFDLGVSQVVFFWVKPLGDYPVSPFRHVSRLGSFVSTFVSVPLLSETS